MCLVSLEFSESEQATQSEKKQDYAIAISKLKLHTNAAENNSKEIFYAKKEIVHTIQTIKIIISIIIIRNLCIV